MAPLAAAVFGILVMALLEAPVFTILAALAMAGLLIPEYDLGAIQLILIEMNRMASMPILIALPLFTLVGVLLAETRSPRRLTEVMLALFGWMPGGIAIAALCVCAFFTALTGASGVTIVAMGSLLYPILRRQQYPPKFTLGLLTTSGSLGLLFPPSLPVILYGVVAQVDIGKMFKAALLPGVLLIVAMAAYAAYRSGAMQLHRDDRPNAKSYGWRRVMKALAGSKWDWPVFGVILGGIYGGIATVTEISALVVVYVVIVECFILREIRFFRQLPGIIIESSLLSGAILIILGFALGLTGVLVDARIPNQILSFLTGLTANKLAFLAGLNLFLLAVGCIMDIFSAIVIIVPIMVPVAMTYGIDPIHLGIIFLVNLEIGYATPPVGMNLFIASLKFNQPVTLLYRASIPYLLLLLGVLVLITYVPGLSLWPL